MEYVTYRTGRLERACGALAALRAECFFVSFIGARPLKTGGRGPTDREINLEPPKVYVAARHILCISISGTSSRDAGNAETKDGLHARL